jgi:hypothetical protein
MILFNKFYSRSSNCPICREFIKYKSFAIVSPWIRERIKNNKKTSLFGICQSCFGATFNFRYDQKQMKLIYEFYRDDNYNELRFKWEKWYGKEYQEGHSAEEYINIRKKQISEFLTIYLPSKVFTVVDIGGGNGELIPDDLPSNFGEIKKYVLDISDVIPIANVTKINSLSEIDTCDLVIYSHTIEHVTDPIFELEEMLKHTRNIYIETPYGIPKTSFLNKSFLLTAFFVLLSLNPKLWRNMFSLSVGLKSKVRILRQSEHINFFQVETLKKLADLVNCDSYVRMSFTSNPLGEKHQIIQALFSRKQPAHTNSNS